MNNNTSIVEWQAPSNIALIKYWGKKGEQLPLNPSVSFTLSKSYTKTKVELLKSDQAILDFNFINNPSLNSKFKIKIENFFKKIDIPFLNSSDKKIKIESFNSFPHSVGIASSASSFAALSLCLIDLMRLNTTEDNFIKLSSNLARKGSGSACRSLMGPVGFWGESKLVEGSSDEYSIKLDNSKVHENYSKFKDAILVVDTTEKEVSSTNGHAAFNLHPYKDARVKQVNKNLVNILEALKSGDLDLFFNVVEDEAFSLHSLIMTSDSNPILFHPNSLALIKKIKELKYKTQIKFGFTLDAGPNIHLLYPFQNESIMKDLIENELKSFCENGKIIYDEVGMGPTKLL